MLGEMTVYHDGIPVNLPASKRTRALLAYLALTSRPNRRDYLCEILWTIPDDPRGALRWSLSKIRPLINDTDTERLKADRERVSLSTSDIAIDFPTIETQSNNPSLNVNELIALARQVEKPLLDGIDIPDQPLFQQWLTAERLEYDRIRARIFSRLSSHADIPPQERLPWARAWENIEPFDTQAAAQLLTLLKQLGETNEHSSLFHAFSKRFQEAKISWPPKLETQYIEEPKAPLSPSGRELLARQKIRFCTGEDKVRIAYASVGEGYPIVKAANWLSHLEHDWEAPVWSPLFRELAVDHQFIRYDERGNGLSDWEVDDISFDAFLKDLETVVDASKVDKFALLGISQGCAVSIAYAVQYPERVSHLILFGGYAAGWRIGANEATVKEREAIMTLTETGWGKDNPAYRHIFSSTFMPSATAEELSWFNDFQRLTTSPANAVRFLSVFSEIDVREQLSQITVPTLVIHSMGDQRIPVNTAREIASIIPNAEFIGLDSDGHLLLARETASKVFVEAVRDFIHRH